MRINQRFVELQAKIDASKTKMQQLDQSPQDLNRADNAVKTVAESGDVYEASTSDQGLHTFSELTSTSSKSALWRTTNSSQVDYKQTGQDSIVKTETTTVEDTFRWFPGISTSNSDVQVTEAKKDLPF